MMTIIGISRPCIYNELGVELCCERSILLVSRLESNLSSDTCKPNKIKALCSNKSMQYPSYGANNRRAIWNAVIKMLTTTRAVTELCTRCKSDSIELQVERVPLLGPV